MSAFIANLVTDDLRVRKASRQPIKMEIIQLSKEIVKDHHMETLNGYEITASYHQRFFCDPKDLHQMIKNAKRIIKEHLYGTFRFQLLELDNAILSQDLTEARSIIKDLREEVFDV